MHGVKSPGVPDNISTYKPLIKKECLEGQIKYIPYIAVLTSELCV